MLQVLVLVLLMIPQLFDSLEQHVVVSFWLVVLGQMWILQMQFVDDHVVLYFVASVLFQSLLCLFHVLVASLHHFYYSLSLFLFLEMLVLPRLHGKTSLYVQSHQDQLNTTDHHHRV